MKNNIKQEQAARRIFKLYKQTISKIVITKLGLNVSDNDLINNWQEKIPYLMEIEQFLIHQTNRYIKLLDSRDGVSYNLCFLNILTDMMADYLSSYTIQSGNIKNIKKAKALLKCSLYDNSNYIQHLKACHQLNQNKKNYAERKFINNKKQKTILMMQKNSR